MQRMKCWGRATKKWRKRLVSQTLYMQDFILFYFNSKETYFINLWIKHIKIKGIRSITPSQLEAKIEARLAPKSLVNHIYMHDFVVQCKSCFVCIQITSLLDTYFSRRTPRSRVQGLVQGDQVCIQILRSFKMNN